MKRLSVNFWALCLSGTYCHKTGILPPAVKLLDNQLYIPMCHRDQIFLNHIFVATLKFSFEIKLFLRTRFWQDNKFWVDQKIVVECQYGKEIMVSPSIYAFYCSSLGTTFIKLHQILVNNSRFYSKQICNLPFEYIIKQGSINCLK